MLALSPTVFPTPHVSGMRLNSRVPHASTLLTMGLLDSEERVFLVLEVSPLDEEQ